MNTPLDTTTFENWMRQIMERFDRNEQLIASLTSKELREVKYLDGEQLLDNQDLCELLNTSKRSIQRYRSSGTLKYQMLWHKVYYKESDVQEFLKTHFKEFEGKNMAKRGKGMTPQTSRREATSCHTGSSPIAGRLIAATFRGRNNFHP
nr:helix-turn-helix domain-containing protein [Bacteroides thetaiotaomicron]